MVDRETYECVKSFCYVGDLFVLSWERVLRMRQGGVHIIR